MPKVSAEHKTKVRENITKAAIKNFSKNGYAITKMDDIAKTADVSKGTLYLYFQSKEDLFESICKSNQRILIDERSGLFQNMGRIRHDLGLFYDNFLKSLQDTQKIRIEALAESVHNPSKREITPEDTALMSGLFTKNPSFFIPFKNSSTFDSISFLFFWIIFLNFGLWTDSASASILIF